MVELLTLLWLFTLRSLRRVHLLPRPAGRIRGAANTTTVFTVKFTVDLKKIDGEKNILEIPGVLSGPLRQHNPQDRAARITRRSNA